MTSEVVMTNEPNDADLSGYEVTILRGVLGWTWRGTSPEGEEVPGARVELRLYGKRELAERAALKALELHAQGPRGPGSISGEELRWRVLKEDGGCE